MCQILQQLSARGVSMTMEILMNIESRTYQTGITSVYMVYVEKRERACKRHADPVSWFGLLLAVSLPKASLSYKDKIKGVHCGCDAFLFLFQFKTLIQ